MARSDEVRNVMSPPPGSDAHRSREVSSEASTTPRTKIGNYRWRVCAMLLAATTISYIDRQVLGVLAPFLQEKIGWTELQYSSIVTAFQAAYAMGLLCAGAVIDRFGTRIGYALAIGIWSLAAMSHSLATGVISFAAARFALGLGEAGNFPAAIKAVAEWFPQRERALAAGIFNSGSNIGAIVAPLMVPIVAAQWGWQAAFLCTGALSAIWLTVWLLTYRTPDQEPRLSPQERAHIGAEPVSPTRRVPWSHLLRFRQTWAFAAAKFITDPIWWFFLFWLPKFLHAKYGLGLLELGAPLIIIFLMADAGSIAGGWLAGTFIKRGMNVNRARKTTMLICALMVVPVIFAAKASHLWLAVLLVGLATAGHQGWSANVYTLTSDLFPRDAVASVVGMGGFAGAVGGMLISTVIGLLLQATGSYVPVFLLAGGAYLVAWLVVQLLVPRLEPAVLAVDAKDT